MIKYYVELKTKTGWRNAMEGNFYFKASDCAIVAMKDFELEDDNIYRVRSELVELK